MVVGLVSRALSYNRLKTHWTICVAPLTNVLMNVLSPFDETVRDLALAQHLPRIKKLLVYACTRHWESDTIGLSSYHLHELVQQLVQIAPTYHELKIHLNGVIQTLNKPAEYTLVANAILRHFQRLYPDAVSQASRQHQSLYQVVTDQLAQNVEQSRIKKLLHFVCRDHWTQDLETVDLGELVREVHVLTPTYDDLTAILGSVIHTISKPEKYRAIAQIITTELAPLYQPKSLLPDVEIGAVAVPTQFVTTTIEPTSAVQTTMAHDPSADQIVLATQETVTVDHYEVTAHGVESVVMATHHTDITQEADFIRHADITQHPDITHGADMTRDADMTQHTEGVEEQYSWAEEIQASSLPSMRQKVSSLSMDELFSMRVEIHKFANPLLAKYLLLLNSYATAVGYDDGDKLGQSNSLLWAALKDKDLDTLLCDALKSCTSVGEFERSLKRTAHQFKPSNRYSTVVNAIVRAIQPIFADYREGSSVVNRAASSFTPDVPTYGEWRSMGDQLSQPLEQLSSDPGQGRDPAIMGAEVGTADYSGNEAIQLETTESDSKVDDTEAEATAQTDGAASGSTDDLPSSIHDNTDQTQTLGEDNAPLDQRQDADLVLAAGSASAPNSHEHATQTQPSAQLSLTTSRPAAAEHHWVNNPELTPSEVKQTVDETAFLPTL